MNHVLFILDAVILDAITVEFEIIELIAVITSPTILVPLRYPVNMEEALREER